MPPIIDLLRERNLLPANRLSTLESAYDGAPITVDDKQWLAADLSAVAARLDRGEDTPETDMAVVLALGDALSAIKSAPIVAAARSTTPTPLGNLPRSATTQPPARTVPRAVTTAMTRAGRPLADLDEIAREFGDTIHHLGTAGGSPDGRTVVARIRSTYPEDRQVTDDPAAGSALVASLLAPGALTAAGGLCAPVPALYELPTFVTTSRPIRDALPSAEALRGGLRWVPPLRMADVSGAVGIWTYATDVTPGANTKPVLRIPCNTESSARVDAITVGLKLGNMGARFAPEVMGQAVLMAAAVASRVAEGNLLTLLGSYSTAVTSAAVLGAARDLLASMETAAVGLRSRARMDPTAELTVVLPSWGLDLLRTDATNAPPGDSTYGLTDQQIAAWFTVRHLRPVWSPDAQALPTQAVGALAALPGTLSFYIFPPTNFLFLDGGTLDLGIVRDSTLNGTNDMIIFSEVFETLAPVGNAESLKVTATLNPSGRVGPSGP